LDIMGESDRNLHRFSGSGWLLPESERGRLLARFPPRYAAIIAHHVTLAPKGAAPPDASDAAIVGRADDGAGVEALVVRIAGSSNRPDGGCYHVTWSLDPGRTPGESNEVIRRHGWTTFDEPVPMRLQPATS
jgi:hypothetical protein